MVMLVGRYDPHYLVNEMIRMKRSNNKKIDTGDKRMTFFCESENEIMRLRYKDREREV